jgi:hypothetical protein
MYGASIDEEADGEVLVRKASIVPVGAKAVFQIEGSVGYTMLKNVFHYILYH